MSSSRNTPTTITGKSSNVFSAGVIEEKVVLISRRRVKILLARGACGFFTKEPNWMITAGIALMENALETKREPSLSLLAGVQWTDVLPKRMIAQKWVDHSCVKDCGTAARGEYLYSCN